MGKSNTRKHERFNKIAGVKYQEHEKSHFACGLSMTKDISLGGVAFLTGKNLDENKNYKITFLKGKNEKEIELSGKVVRSLMVVEDEDKNYITAVEFHDLTPEQEESLKKFLAEEH